MKSLIGKARAKPLRKVDNEVVGWREYVALPGLGLERVHAKLDTGARTSAIHADNIKLFDQEGQLWVAFHPAGFSLKASAKCRAPVFDQRPIKNTSGKPELRIIIKTALVIGNVKRIAELSLADRGNMSHVLIIGRTAIRRYRLLVDSGHSYLRPLMP